MMATMNISLPDSLKAFAHDQTQTDSYSNPSDYVRSLIREDKAKKEAQQHIEALLLDGLNSGDPIPVTPKYWKTLREELTEEIKNN
jgi:antitoxin ParD1/3/4